MSETKTKTGPHLVTPQSSPSPEEGTAYREEAAPFDPRKANQAALSNLVGAALTRKGVPAPVASEVTQELLPVILKAASKVPPWVLYFAIFFGVPALTAFYATWQSIEALPPRVEKLEETQAKQGAQLDRIEALLQGPTSRPRF